MKTKYFPLLLIIIIAFLLRVVLLDKIPSGISDDELDYIFNAKAVFLTGKDVTGQWSPFSLTTPPLEYLKAELPYIFTAPFVGPFPFSLFSARLPYVFYNLILVIVLYFVAYKLFGKPQAIIVGLIAAINPWMIYFGRTAFDAPLAVLFYFIGFLILILVKKWKILLTLPFLFFAFYSYIGTKIILIPFTVVITAYCWLWVNNKKYLKQYLTLLFLVSIIFVYYVINLQNNKDTSRISDLLSPSHPAIAKEVDNQRKLAIDTPIKNIYSNKITVLMKQVSEKYLGVFSTQFLFLYGDGRSTFSVWNHGMFYILDLLFIGIGLYGLYRKQKITWFLIVSLILIAPLPSVISTVGTTYPIRAAILFPVLILIIGYGIWYVLYSFKNTRSKKIFILLFIVFYLVSLSNFLNIYFFRNPIYNSEGFGFSGRILSRYIAFAEKHNQKIIIIDQISPKSVPTLFKQYLFYTNNYNSTNKQNIKDLFNKEHYEYKNLLIENCAKKETRYNATLILPSGSKCNTILSKNARNLSIAHLSDGGEIYKIFDDKVCSKYHLERYPSSIQLGDLDIETISEKRFCQQFITNLK